MEKKILITGGTGTTGSRIAKRLVRLGAGVRIASRRMPAMAGTEHVYFDWNDQKTYRDALKNTNSLYLVAPVGVFEPSPLVVPFLEMAAASGVRRIVLLSAAIIDEDGPVFGKLHHAVRRYVPEWTVLKPSYFMQNFDHQHGASIRKKNEIVTASGSGKVLCR